MYYHSPSRGRCPKGREGSYKTIQVMIKKEYMEPQLEVINAEDQLMQQISVSPEEETHNNDSMELDFEEE